MTPLKCGYYLKVTYSEQMLAVWMLSSLTSPLTSCLEAQACCSFITVDSELERGSPCGCEIFSEFRLLFLDAIMDGYG